MAGIPNQLKLGPLVTALLVKGVQQGIFPRSTPVHNEQ